MKRLFFWAIAAALVCGSTVFTSCNVSDDNPVIPDLNLSEKIIGKWMPDNADGKAVLTNNKSVITIISATKGTISTAINSRTDMASQWVQETDLDVVINGNMMTLTSTPDEHQKVVEEFNVTAISDTEFTAEHKMTITVDGSVTFTSENVVSYAKVPVDYTADIVGTWQGRCTSEGSVFDDGQEHRWQYNADGTYIYYVKDGDNWVASDNTMNEYFVDGNLLCSRWKNAGENTENREWWEITIDNGVMNWQALRQNTDGTTFTATFEMTKVQ